MDRGRGACNPSALRCCVSAAFDPAERIGGDVADPESQDAAYIAAEHAANTCVRDLELAVGI